MHTRLLVATALAATSCHPKAEPTPAGTVVLEWKNTATKLSTGVGIGAALEAPRTETLTIEFTPNGEVRDHSLARARLELVLEREDVALTPAPSGAAPAERGALPIHAVAKVVDSGGWRFDKATCDPLGGPADIGEQTHRAGFVEQCLLPMRGGRDDMASIVVTIAGNGAHQASGTFGTATIH